jgi:hypothetical protein
MCFLNGFFGYVKYFLFVKSGRIKFKRKFRFNRIKLVENEISFKGGKRIFGYF